MSNNRAYNFSAGPSMLPINVIEEIAENLADYEGCGHGSLTLPHMQNSLKR